MTPPGRRYALKLAYDGSGYRGWQRQPGLSTVQGAVEDALAAALGGHLHVDGASRTDAGVSAEGQVASLTSRRGLSPDELGAALAPHLPPAVRLVTAAEASPSFHARSSAAGKRYRYRYVWGAPAAGAFFLGGEAAPRWELARAALDGLAGLPQLSGLSSPARDRKPAPPLEAWTLAIEASAATLEVRARAFRKHQVRNLAGHLAAVALGLCAPETLAVLAARTRPWSGATAPAAGLTLVEVFYPPELDPFRPR